MNRPTECKWCGAKGGQVRWECAIDFSCGSIFWIDDCIWTCDDDCADGLRNRIQRAVEVLKGADRWEIITGYESDMERRSNGEWIEYEQAEQALEILRGNSPESADSSPVTADQLATADYFEAVRQQVPWMTAVEHIDGLVEGYRRCGLMVWRAAEQVKLIFGGVNDEAE